MQRKEKGDGRPPRAPAGGGGGGGVPEGAILCVGASGEKAIWQPGQRDAGECAPLG